jgi:hypothetical protein
MINDFFVTCKIASYYLLSCEMCIVIHVCRESETVPHLFLHGSVVQYLIHKIRQISCWMGFIGIWGVCCSLLDQLLHICFWLVDKKENEILWQCDVCGPAIWNKCLHRQVYFLTSDFVMGYVYPLVLIACFFKSMYWW